MGVERRKNAIYRGGMEVGGSIFAQMFTIAATLYYPLYQLIVLVFTLGLCLRYANLSNRRLLGSAEVNYSQLVPAVVLMLFVAFFIGFRPTGSNVFGDTVMYALNYESAWGWFDPSDIDGDWVFNYIMGYMAGQRMPLSWFFTVIDLLYFGLMYLACLKMFPRDSLLAFVVYLGAFSTFSFGTNGIRNGMAASIFLCALAFWRSKVLVVGLALLSFATHHGMMLPACALLCVWLVPRPRLWMAVWVVCLIIAALHITWFQDLFAQLTDESGEGYLATENMGEWGGTLEGKFRYDFVLYSAIPLWVGWRAMKKLHRPSARYRAVFNCYALCNSIWMLCMFANFTNRIAYLSWFLIPILLVYPYLRQEFVRRQYKELSLVAALHFAFTLFMWLIYYKVLK